jgi:hypothetical protein
MDSTYISPKDLSHPSWRSTWRTIGLHCLLALCDFEERGPASSHRETRIVESIQDSVPQYRRSVFNHPSRGDTWQQVEPSQRLAHRNSNAQKTTPSYPDMRSRESIQELGPTTTSSEVRTVRSRGCVAPD